MRALLSVAMAGALFLSGCMTPLPIAKRLLDQSSLLGEWYLIRVDQHSIANAISLEFRSDGQVNGAIACNSFMTDYSVNDRRIEIGDTIITAAGCHPRFNANQRLLEKAEAVLVAEPPAAMTDDGEKLVLTGDNVLVFERRR